MGINKLDINYRARKMLRLSMELWREHIKLTKPHEIFSRFVICEYGYTTGHGPNQI